MKKSVTLDSGLVLEVDLARAASPEARHAIYRNDKKGDPLALFDFLDLAIGSGQTERLIASLRHPDGSPGTDAEFGLAFREMVEKLGKDAKKS